MLSNINFIDNTDILISLSYGLIFILIGILFKIGAVPFHFWLPDVYEGAPNNISSFFAIVPKIAFISILIRLFFDVFSPISYFFEIFLALFYNFIDLFNLINQIYYSSFNWLLS